MFSIQPEKIFFRGCTGLSCAGLNEVPQVVEHAEEEDRPRGSRLGLVHFLTKSRVKSGGPEFSNTEVVVSDVPALSHDNHRCQE